MNITIHINLNADNVSHALAMIADLKQAGIMPIVNEPSVKPMPYIDPAKMEEYKARQEYKNVFGKAFRLRKGQDETNILAIIQSCIERGVDNGQDNSLASDTHEDNEESIIDDGRDVFA